MISNDLMELNDMELNYLCFETDSDDFMSDEDFML